MNFLARNLADARTRWRRTAAVVLPVAFLAACDVDSLLDSPSPTQLAGDDVEKPGNAALLVNSVIADFECAHGAFMTAGAVMGDELEDAQLAAATWFYDRRDFNSAPGGIYGSNGCSGQLFGVYSPLSTARWSADNILTKLTEDWAAEEIADRERLVATAAVYGGFSLTEMGMLMCSAALDNGPELSSSQLFQEAEDRFTRAIAAAQSANQPTLVNAAYAGRARVRLYLGDTGGAEADAQQIPPGFVFEATATDGSVGRRWNQIHAQVNFNRFHMVAEGSRNLTTGGVPDPRTEVVQTDSRSHDGRLSVMQTKYPSLGSPAPVTRYEEAQLILAEIRGGQFAVDVINALRAPHDLPPVSAEEQANLQQTLIEERRRELWLEGQRFYDLTRFNVPFDPAPGTPFPKGGEYGSTRCLPLPDIERFNNPSIS